MIRTLHIDTEPAWRGGEQQALLLVEGLAARGLPAILLARPDSPLLARARAAGLDARPFLARGDGDVRAAWRLARLVRAERPDIVHTHTAHGHGVAVAAARLFLGRCARPKLVVARRVDFSIFRHGIPLLGLNRLKYRAADRIVAVSSAVREVLIGDGLDPATIAVVRDGVPLLAAPPSAAAIAAARRALAPGAPENAPLAVNIAHLAPHKGQRFLIEAVPALRAARPDVRVAIVGGGGAPLRGELEALARALGVADAVAFAGFRSPEEIPAIAAAADVVVHPSVEEGLGSSLLEAMAAGAPVVATRAGGIPEIVRDGETGVLVPPRDPAALAAAILALLADRPRAARLGAGARAFARLEGGAARMVEETVRVYEEVLGRPLPAACSGAPAVDARATVA